MGSSRANRAQRIGCLRERDLHTAHSRFVEFQQQDLHPSTKMTNSATCERASVGAYRAITLELEFQLQGVRLPSTFDSVEEHEPCVCRSDWAVPRLQGPRGDAFAHAARDQALSGACMHSLTARYRARPRDCVRRAPRAIFCVARAHQPTLPPLPRGALRGNSRWKGALPLR